ncbi:NADPH-dependent FMN reductase [Flavobacterium sp. ASW18X]|uniref:NADPH-dependent FMN reductase n=1 Tax=Flavobacterium sp. ASW18X TaxID=2572595 RepID=UPI0010ADDE83|nr:NAD(P)H-dependent oxidoreductase [Flavobacterium sp. ASW18X]TKD66999.1 NAD(P)H-dependent oxidoreductase [Flavobacterium sp. ASW18X]
MITILSGSNRNDNHTLKFAQLAKQLLQKTTKEEVVLVDMAALASWSVTGDMYGNTSQPAVIKQLQDEIIIPSQKFWFFVPEYNGSYPGIVKLVLDAISVRDSKESFQNKKAIVTGVASGRAGNLRGMDHLADVLNHLGMFVHPNKLPISSIYKYMDDNKMVVGEEIKELLQKQISQLLNFN